MPMETTTYKSFETVHVPDLTGTDGESAKMILVNNGLVPVIAEEYSNYMQTGLVTRTEPVGFTEVERGTRVTVYISRGLSKYFATNAQVSADVLDTMFGDNDKVYVNVNSIYVEENVLHVIYNIGFKEYRNDYNHSFDTYPGSITYYFKYSDISVNIDGNLFTPIAFGEAIDTYVKRNRRTDPIKYDEIHLQIPLNDSVSRNPNQINVTYTAQVHLDNQYDNYTSDHSYRSTFRIQNITW